MCPKVKTSGCLRRLNNSQMKPAFSTKREVSFAQNQERAGGRWRGEREGRRGRGRDLSRGEEGRLKVEEGGIQVGGQEEGRVVEVEGGTVEGGEGVIHLGVQ